MMSQAQITALYWFSWAAAVAFAAGAALTCDREAFIFAVVFFGCAVVLLMAET